MAVRGFGQSITCGCSGESDGRSAGADISALPALRDETGKSWQVVLFKRVTAGEVESLNLRLVGFPGVAEFAHPQPLEITAANGGVFPAADRFAAGAPAANVGAPDLLEILPQLPKNSPVRLSLPLGQNQSLTVRVPLPVVLEWQDIATRKY